MSEDPRQRQGKKKCGHAVHGSVRLIVPYDNESIQTTALTDYGNNPSNIAVSSPTYFPSHCPIRAIKSNKYTEWKPKFSLRGMGDWI